MTDSTYVGGGEQGATNERFSVFDQVEQVVTSAYEQHKRSYPEPEQVEHDPTDIGEQIRGIITPVLDEANPDELRDNWQMDRDVRPLGGFRRSKSDVRAVEGCRRTGERPKIQVAASDLSHDSPVREGASNQLDYDRNHATRQGTEVQSVLRTIGNGGS